MNKISNDDLKTNYAIVRSKLALQRTIFISLVSLKAGILYAIQKRLTSVIIIGVIISLIIAFQYVYILNKFRHKQLVDDQFFDWVPLIFIFFFLGSVYISYVKKK